MEYKWYKRGDEERRFAIVGDKVNAVVDGVMNPTIAEIEANGWAEFIKPIPQPYVPTYEEKVVRLIREKYDMNDEAKYSRWNIEVNILKTKTLSEEEVAELSEYSEYVSWCHEEAKKEEE